MLLILSGCSDGLEFDNNCVDHNAYINSVADKMIRDIYATEIKGNNSKVKEWEKWRESRLLKCD